jgi:hypothetical protein
VIFLILSGIQRYSSCKKQAFLYVSGVFLHFFPCLCEKFPLWQKDSLKI